MKIRYYADADIEEWHSHMCRLLGQLHDEYGLTVEIDRIVERHRPIEGFPGAIRAATPEEVYERDLKRNRALIAAIDEAPSTAYKRSGNLEIAGNVAIVDDDETVQWASTLPGYADGYRPGLEHTTALDFLEDVARDPSNRVCVKCLDQLDGDEHYCPNCGTELS